MKGKQVISSFLWADEIMGEAKAAHKVRVRRGLGLEDSSIEASHMEGGSKEASEEGDREEEEAFMEWYRERK